METNSLAVAAEPAVPGVFDVSAVLAEVDRLLADGHSTDARTMLERARVDAHGVGDVAAEARILRALANVERAAGDLEPARSHYLEALDIVRSEQDTAAEGNLLLSLGDTLRKLRKAGEARESYRTAARVYQEINDPLGCAHAEFKLGQTTIASDPGLALEHFTRAAGFYETADKLIPVNRLRLESPPLPAKVDDSRLIEPYIMVKVALRETQRLRTLQEQALKKVVAQAAQAPGAAEGPSNRRYLLIAGVLFGGVILTFLALVILAR